MADEATGKAPAKKKKFPLIAAAMMSAMAMGGGSFFVVYSGLVDLPPLPGTASHGTVTDDSHAATSAEGPIEADNHADGFKADFVTLEPLVVPLGASADAALLRTTLVLETTPDRAGEVTAATPRVMDVLNTFLRAVEERVLTDPREMARLRAQMLRRVRLVTPQGAVRDILIQEFVLS